MAQDRGRKASVGTGAQARGLAVVRVMIGVFFLFEGLDKLAWLTSSGSLAGQLAGYLEHANSISRWYLETVAIPSTPISARLVLFGELSTGVALILGVWTRLAAALACLMVLNFHVASGAIFQYRFLTNGYGLPVLGALLGLAIGGAGKIRE